jgi:hypothetical protein
MQQYRIKRPPRALRGPGVRLDNVALVPASLLPYKKEWQAVANGLPQGSVLVCSTTNPRQQKILEHVSAHLKRKGHRVRTLPAKQFAARTCAGGDISMRRTTNTNISAQIRARYGTNRRGKSYAHIAREFGVSRSLVHIVLTRPLSPRSPVVRRRRTDGMGSLVVRVPSEDLNHLRILADTHSQTISALLREILIAYCRQL